jgi:hypothetical protein
VKITPPIANPALPPAQPERKTLAVEATQALADVGDEHGRHTPGRQMADEVMRAQWSARVEVLASSQRGASSQARRAMASYNAVADQGQRDSLRHLLGFDDYA